MNKIAHLLRTNRYLNILASVKLAVPLMVVLIIVVAVGTIFESLYNSDYAKMAVYNTSWFFALMALLFVNILCAALSRWPYKKHHTGFVVTHIGMLILLIGSFMTSIAGLDAQLAIPEGASNSTMVLPETVLGYQFSDSARAQYVQVPRGLSSYEASRDSALNSSLKHLFVVKKYIPFATAARVVVPTPSGATGDNTHGVGVSFRMKSKFFEVSEWLQSEENPSMSLGPAKLELKVGRYSEAAGRGTSKASSKKKSAAIEKPKIESAPVELASRAVASAEASIRVIDLKSQKVLGEKAPAEIARHPWVVAGAQIRLKKAYKFAMIASNKIAEGTGPEPNPAFEFEVVKGGETKREILFAKFANFSLNPDGVFGLRITMGGAAANLSPETMAAHGGALGGGAGASKAAVSTEDVVSGQAGALPAGHPQVAQKSNDQAEAPVAVPPGTPPPMGSNRNVIEFWVDPNDKEDRAEIVLRKEGQLVAHETIAAGQTYQTPWMGMQVTLASVVRGGQTRVVAEPIEPTKGKNLPPSALEIELADGSDHFWLVEGTSQQVSLMGRPAVIFFDRRTIDLPFQMKLEKFTKRDYPGTETPMSYESLVQLPATGETHLISMNEPLKKDGFTIYQSSYVLEEGRPPESVFSVNDDPGRPVKYAGALILAIGIILFTVMRSDWYLQRMKEKNLEKRQVTA
jgi:hypothetical protein